MSMGSTREMSSHWSVFDGVKFLPSKPDVLMLEINTAIAALEFARASSVLNNSRSSTSSSTVNSSNSSQRSSNANVFDARISEEAYKSGCMAMAEGKLEEAFHSFKVSLSKCPPDKIEAVSKIKSLISFTYQQLRQKS